jgi:hypothetical protein
MPTSNCDIYFDMSIGHVSKPGSRTAHEGK